MTRRYKTVLYSLSHSRQFLWTMVVGIFLTGLVVGQVLTWVFPPARDPGEPIMVSAGQGDEAGALDYFSSMLDQPGPKMETVLTLLPFLASTLSPEGLAHIAHTIEGSSLAPAYKPLALGLLKSLVEPGNIPDARLIESSQKDPPRRYAHQALALYWIYAGKMDEAALAFENEGRFPDAEISRTRAVQLYLQLERMDDLARLQSNPAYAQAFTPGVHFGIALAGHNWRQMVRWLIPSQYYETPGALLLLALCAGLIWLNISLQAVQLDSLFSGRFFLCLAAVILGVLSTIPTVLTGVWEEEILGLTWSGELAEGLIYFVAGVGLREELWKLIFFAPLVPVLVKRRDSLEILMVAACVGLGFAAEENVQYFRQSTLAAPGRFLTANFFHMALTGISGLYLCRAVRSPRHGVVDFLAVFFVIIVTHGVYNALISVPALMEYSMFSITAFILLSFQFFHELHEFREPRRDTISLTAHFLFGLSGLAAFTYVLVSRQLGPALALQVLVPTLLEMGLIAYMFLREFRETIR